MSKRGALPLRLTGQRQLPVPGLELELTAGELDLLLDVLRTARRSVGGSAKWHETHRPGPETTRVRARYNSIRELHENLLAWRKSVISD